MHIHYTRWAVLTVLGLLTACHQAPKTAGDMVPDRVIAPMAKARTVEDLTPYIASATLCPTDGAQDFAVPPFKTLLRPDAFYFLNGSAVWRLSRDGKELRQIGRSGRGPGEYLAVEDFCLDVSDSEVLCMTSYRGGGVLRDVMAGDMPYIFVKHVYACASLVGALICVLLPGVRRVSAYLSVFAPVVHPQKSQACAMDRSGRLMTNSLVFFRIS